MLDGLDVVDLCEDDRLAGRVRRALAPLSDDLVASILRRLDAVSRVCFLVSCLGKRRGVLLTQYSQGKRSEIGPWSCTGFGSHDRVDHVLVHGDTVFRWPVSPRVAPVLVSTDRDDLLKLVQLLQNRGEWRKGDSCASVDAWRRRLIRAL